MLPSFERYQRQMNVPGFGPDAQSRLARSSVLVVGCGGLGTHSANTLVRAGVGHIVIVDTDRVEPSNLQRQSLYDQADVDSGEPKASIAARKLRSVNPQVLVEPRVMRFDKDSASELVGAVDLVLDATDNFATRYQINDECVRLRKPWIFGGVIATCGMMMSVLPGQSPCLRCVFPEAPVPAGTPNAVTHGVLEPTVAVCSSMQCTEALKYLIGASDEMTRGLVQFDLWQGQMQLTRTGERLANCPACSAINA